MVGEVGGQRLELRILAGDVTSAARTQRSVAVIGVDQQPVAVPLALERPLRTLRQSAPPTRGWPASAPDRLPLATGCSFIRCASQFLPSVWISA